jgi:hypothetical protein
LASARNGQAVVALPAATRRVRERSKMFAYVAILASLAAMSVVSFAAALMAG